MHAFDGPAATSRDLPARRRAVARLTERPPAPSSAMPASPPAPSSVPPLESDPLYSSSSTRFLTLPSTEFSARPTSSLLSPPRAPRDNHIIAPCERSAYAAALRDVPRESQRRQRQPAAFGAAAQQRAEGMPSRPGATASAAGERVVPFLVGGLPRTAAADVASGWGWADAPRAATAELPARPPPLVVPQAVQQWRDGLLSREGGTEWLLAQSSREAVSAALPSSAPSDPLLRQRERLWPATPERVPSWHARTHHTGSDASYHVAFEASKDELEAEAISPGLPLPAGKTSPALWKTVRKGVTIMARLGSIANSPSMVFDPHAGPSGKRARETRALESSLPVASPHHLGAPHFPAQPKAPAQQALPKPRPSLSAAPGGHMPDAGSSKARLATGSPSAGQRQKLSRTDPAELTCPEVRTSPTAATQPAAADI